MPANYIFVCVRVRVRATLGLFLVTRAAWERFEFLIKRVGESRSSPFLSSVFNYALLILHIKETYLIKHRARVFLYCILACMYCKNLFHSESIEFNMAYVVLY